ncbi:hypothetical protein VTH82DRAFT_243 [Thermothelomyces myriococcoides]
MARANPDEIDLAEDDLNDTGHNDYGVTEENASMASTMGFTSFGGGDNARPFKKRRFNPHLDEAVIATRGPGPTAHTAGPVATHGITYNDDDNDGFTRDDDDDGADYLDADAPPTPSGAAFPAMTAGSQPAGGWYNPGNFQRGRGGRGRGGARGGGGRGGGRGGSFNPFWYEDYYDPSFNENPWERLEKLKGLEPVGTWLSRSQRNWRGIATGKDEQQQQQQQQQQRQGTGESIGARQGLAEGTATPAAS